MIGGNHELDGCWALDRVSDAEAGPAPVSVLLDSVRDHPMQRSSAAIAARMAEVLGRFEWPDDLVVVPVPTSELADVLARALASLLEVPYERALRRRGGRNVPTPKMAVRPRVAPANVLLVDDVVHTGMTLRTCARVLSERGTEGVWAIVAAIDVPTPSPAATVAAGGTVDRVAEGVVEDAGVRANVDRTEPVIGADQLEDPELAAAVGEAVEALVGMEALRSMLAALGQAQPFDQDADPDEIANEAPEVDADTTDSDSDDESDDDDSDTDSDDDSDSDGDSDS